MAAVPAVPAIVNQDLFIQAQNHHQPAGQNLIAQLTYPLQARFERWIKHKKARKDILDARSTPIHYRRLLLYKHVRFIPTSNRWTHVNLLLLARLIDVIANRKSTMLHKML
jgi:hypothetical protein